MSATDMTRPRTGTARLWAVLVALVMLPLLVAASVGWAAVGAEERRPAVRAAVVNHDVPVTIEGQMVPMGRQFAAALVEGPDDDTSFTWVLSDDEDAASGLDSGRYVARVVIPEDFSRAATSYGGDPDGAEQATIDITTSSIVGVSDAEVARQLAAAAARSLNSTLTEGYLDQVYLGFNKSAEGMRQLADGTGQLADGAAELTAGARQASDGSVQLADGLGQLDAGGPALVDGAAQLDAGARQLADGLGQLQAGTAALPEQTAQLADGSRQVADGVAQLSAGLDLLAGGADQLAGGAGTYADGVAQYTDGVTQAADGARQLSDGIDQLVGGLSAAIPSQEELVRIQGIVDELRPVLDQVIAALADMEGTADRLAAGTGAVEAGLDRAVTDLEAVAAGALDCPTGVGPVGSEACAAWEQGVTAGAEEALRLLTTTDATSGYSVVTGARAAAEGARGLQELVAANGGTLPGLDQAQLEQISAALDDLPGTVGQLQAGVQQLDDGASQLADGLLQLSANGPALVDGARQLADGAFALSTGAGDAASGVAQLADGADQVATGTEQLAAGMVPLADGIAGAADGADQYADGVSAFSSGLGQYVDGVAQTSDGARQLSDGLVQLSDGTDQLADGTDELATQVADGVDEIPTYDDADRQRLATVVASPIATENLTAGVTPRIAIGALVATLALWLGAIATSMVVRPLGDRLLASSRPTGELVLRSLGPAAAIVAVQGAGVAAVAAPLMGIGPGRAVGLAAILVLGGAAFALVTQALAAWLGNAGRLVAVLMAALTLAGALTSAVPGLYDALHPLLAPVPVLEAVRAVATGGGVTGPVFAILAWGLLGAVAGALAVTRRRGLTPAQFLRSYA